MTKLEEVALAICKVAGEPEDCAKFYMGAACAAVEALREPSDAMVKAGLVGLVGEIERIGGAPNMQPTENQKYMQLGSLIRCGSEIKAAHTAMIDAILSEKTDGIAAYEEAVAAGKTGKAE